MGIRLEFVMILLFVVIIVMTAMVKLTNPTKDNSNPTKELEFTDTTFIEVDRHRRLAHSFSTYGVRDAGILHLENIIYHTNNIELLLADKGTYGGNILYLEGNVSLEEKKGFLYKAQYAIYNQETEILEIPSAFTAKLNQNIIKGITLYYNAKKKETNATKIDAVVYTSKK